MPTKHGITIFFVPHNRKDPLSVRLKGWQVLAAGIIFGIALVLFVLGVVFGGRSTRIMAENRAIRAENERLREQRLKIIQLERELAGTSELRRWMLEMVGADELAQIPVMTAGVTEPRLTAFFDRPFRSRLFPEMEEAAEATRRRRDFVPRGLPVKGTITARFGEMDHRFLKPHSGVDIAAPRGTPVLSTATGIIAEVISDPVLGNAVEIDHLSGFTTRYAHLELISVKRGDWVERGAKIGTVGSTGRAEGAHVHYTLLESGTPINPINDNKIAQEG
ncbi:MAG TPA: M23 family metallopeptidase [candidate division Zixibacteria bacterium]|nr:M23 family metallopeptidase [candidate division Zixibacteria bacterium]